MSHVIVALNALSLTLLAVALFLVLAKIIQKKIQTDTGLFMSSMFCFIMFVNFSNVLEHAKITDQLDYYEDFLEILFPVFFVLFLNSIRLHADIERHKSNVRKLDAMLRERNELIKEIHHRVKNNLQVVISILNLHRHLNGVDAELEAALIDTENRICSMAAVHEMIYQAENYSNLPADELLRSIAGQVARNFPEGHSGNIRAVFSIDAGISLTLETAVPFSMIVNEIISNVYLHAYPDGSGGTVTVSLWMEDGMAALEIRDDGVGLHGAVPGADHPTLGFMLINNLTGQIGGTVAFEANGGTVVTVRFPV